MIVPDIITEVKAGREVPRCQLEYAVLVLDSLARPGEAKEKTPTPPQPPPPTRLIREGVEIPNRYQNNRNNRREAGEVGDERGV